MKGRLNEQNKVNIQRYFRVFLQIFLFIPFGIYHESFYFIYNDINRGDTGRGSRYFLFDFTITYKFVAKYSD